MVDTAIHNIAVSKFTHTLVDYKSTGRKEVTPMANPGCVGNYANQLAESSANVGWMICYCQDIIYDYVYGNNGVSLAEAKKAEAYLLQHGISLTVDLDKV